MNKYLLSTFAIDNINQNLIQYDLKNNEIVDNKLNIEKPKSLDISIKEV